MRVRNKHLFCFLCFALLSAICVITCIVVGWTFRVRHFEGTDVDNLNPDIQRTIFLQSELLSVDPVASTVVFNWIVWSDNCGGRSLNCTPVSLFFDTNLLKLNGDNWDKNLTNRLPEVPIFTWNPELFDIGGTTPVFRTTSVLFTQQTKNDSTLQNYPFDTYTTVVFIWGQDAETREVVNVQRAFTFGIAVGFKAESNNTLSLGTGAVVNSISFRRSSLIKSYVFIIVVGIWLITLTFLGSMTKVAFGYAQPRETFVIPIGTLFAITSLRSSMPGAPDGFGAILDFVGVLPCLAIITLTGVLLFAYLVISNNEVTDGEPPLFKLPRANAVTVSDTKDYSRITTRYSEYS